VIVAKATTTFILVPAIHGTDKLFIRQIEELEDFGRVLTVAYPHRGPQTMEAFKDLVLEKANSVNGSIVLIGHSTGAAVVLFCLKELAHRIPGIVLINSGTGVRYTRPLVQGLAKVVDFLPPALYKPIAGAVVPLTNNYIKVNRRSFRTLRSVTRGLPPRVLAQRLKALASYRPEEEDFSYFHGEILIVASLLDMLVPSFFEAFSLKRQFPGARAYFQFLNGHDCIIESGFRLLDAVSYHNFLQDVFGDRASSSGEPGGSNQKIAAE
jgi:pimeloyl-ACP methyl ester carboxylesterase